MRQYLWLFLVGALVLTGCEVFRQGAEDYSLGRTAPYAEGERTVQEQTNALVNTISAIPYANVGAPVVAVVAPYILTWLRGRRKRKQNQGISTNPITGPLGKDTGAEVVVQHVADVLTGALEWGRDGSGFKRAIKIGLLALPVIQFGQEILTQYPPSWINSGLLATIIGVLAGAEKWLSKVKPLAEPPPAPPQH